MEVFYKPSFIRQINTLPKDLQEEAIEKITEFKNQANHPQLRVHKLKEKLLGFWSFSVNYRYRIVFEWGKNKKSAVLLAIGDHDVYR